MHFTQPHIHRHPADGEGVNRSANSHTRRRFGLLRALPGAGDFGLGKAKKAPAIAGRWAKNDDVAMYGSRCSKTTECATKI